MSQLSQSPTLTSPHLSHVSVLHVHSSKGCVYNFTMSMDNHRGQFGCSVMSNLWDPMDCSTPGFLVHHQLPELAQFMSIKLVMPSNRLILSCPLLLLPSIFPSIRVISNESVLWITWPKYWRFSFSISPSNEYSGLISFRMDWLNLLAVQGALKSFLQHHSSKASILQGLAFFMIQLSYPYLTTGKTISLTRQIKRRKKMSFSL